MAKSFDSLSRRERQIMDILYRRGRATAGEVLAEITGDPSYSTVRPQLRGSRWAALRHWVLSAAINCAAATPVLQPIAPAWMLSLGGASALRGIVPVSQSVVATQAEQPADPGDVPRGGPAPARPSLGD